ncbi:MAG: TRAP transporter substrate-binding protein DctP [Gammaproteobacteria bacterium]|nr:TRAP transporter substrate-binding protein DctP [Gammaproteobacteria bacterium]
MKKSTALALLLLFGYCAPNSYATTFKVASLSPSGSAWMNAMKGGAKEIKQRSEGRVKFKFYPGGVMGDDKAVLKKIRIRQLHGGALMAGSLSKFYADSQIYNSPLVFKNFNEVDYVRAKMDQKIIDGFEKGGFVSFGLAEAGFAYAMSKTPLTNSADLKQRKVWAPSDDKASLEIIRTYGITPIPLAIPDVLAGLQTGIIDTVAVSPIGALALQWHTQIKHITDIPLMYTYALFVLEKKAFYRLSDNDQALVREVMTKTFTKIDKQNRQDNIAALKALQNQDITITAPSEAEQAAWNTKAKLAAKNLIESGEVSSEIMEEFLLHLDAFHSQQASTLSE